MASKAFFFLALAASSAASAVPRSSQTDAPKNWVTYSLTRAQRQHAVKRDNDVPLFNVTAVSYLIELSIGSPGQPVKVAIDTGSDELWVNPDCNSPDLTSSQSNECLKNAVYDPSRSSSATDAESSNEVQYGKGFVSFEYFKDTIALPESTINVTDTQFGVATQSSELNEGILGLGWGNGFNLKYNNLVDELADQKVTNSRAFSMALGSVDESNAGSLIFGGVDTKKFSGSLVTNQILKPQNGESLYRYWVGMNSISFNAAGQSSKQYDGSRMAVVIDSGSSLSYLPSALVRSIASDFDGQFDSQNGLYLVPCSQRNRGGSLDFAFGDATIKVPFSEFLWQFDGSTCVLGAVPASSGQGITALLGDSFMRSAFIVFDQTNKALSMAQYVNCGTNEQAIQAGGVGNMTGECKAPSFESNSGARFTYSSVVLIAGGLIGVITNLM